MNKNTTTIWIIAILVIGAASFYGGMTYAGTKKSANSLGQNGGNFQNLTPDQRAQRFAQGGPGAGSGAARNGGQNGAGFAGGDILSKDDKSITVKMRDGSSKIIFFSPATQILKSTSGTPADLKIGENVIVNGKADQSNTITADSIQLRPFTASSTPPGPGR
jgi:hypothetical protein